MEKFYIVKNEKFLKEVSDYYENWNKQNLIIKEFFEKHGVEGTGYYICGDGGINCPFDEYGKKDIRLYVSSTEMNNRLFGKQLKQERIFDDGEKMRCFRSTSKILKEFQELCVERKIPINLHFMREGDYFKETYLGGYSVSRFRIDEDYYLRISAHKDSLTPKYDGFIEIKGSEYFTALERYEESENEK